MWQPITTAPKDGTIILGYFPSRIRKMVPMEWSGWGGGTWCNSTSGANINDDPTHWMPMPAPPSDAL